MKSVTGPLNEEEVVLILSKRIEEGGFHANEGWLTVDLKELCNFLIKNKLVTDKTMFNT